MTREGLLDQIDRTTSLRGEGCMITACHFQLPRNIQRINRTATNCIEILFSRWSCSGCQHYSLNIESSPVRKHGLYLLNPPSPSYTTQRHCTRSNSQIQESQRPGWYVLHPSAISETDLEMRFLSCYLVRSQPSICCWHYHRASWSIQCIRFSPSDDHIVGVLNDLSSVALFWIELPGWILRSSVAIHPIVMSSYRMGKRAAENLFIGAAPLPDGWDGM